MADKVDVTDVSKLRPELLNLSVKEIDRQIAELQMAKTQKEEEERAKARAALVDEAGAHVDNVLDGLRWLHTNGFLAQGIIDFFSTAPKAAGDKPTFVPHLKMKRPRS